MKIRLLPLVGILVLAGCAAGGPGAPAVGAPLGAPPIVASLDLVNIADDRVMVEIDPPTLPESAVLFRLPRVVQGTYEVSDFGSYAEDLRAFGYDGASIEVERLDANSWQVSDGSALDRLTYYVNDTYDIERSVEDAPFSPAGTNIDPHIFLLNLHGFVGYFEGMTERPYEIRMTAPAGVSKSSALRSVGSERASGGAVTDVYQAARYFEVTDNPMMYGDVDRAEFSVEGIEIVLSVYSPTGAHTAAQLRPDMQRMMAAQRTYLGDIETTDKYDIYLFLSADDEESPAGYGALEHHKATTAVLPEWLDSDRLAEEMVNTISHEFFHIVSPLSVHSEDIHYFDYNTPTFSKHLWLYEGGTEYFANHFQVYEGIESRSEFYDAMSDKVDMASTFDDEMSFTVMSENIVDEPYASNYINVYQKGALIVMCLDVAVYEGSGGTRSWISIMAELSDIYGVERPFQDDALIDEITEMTYPSVGDFLRTHVVGTTPIDYSDCLEPVGLRVVEREVPVTLLFYSPEIPYIDGRPATGELFFRDVPGFTFNSTLVEMGVEPGDVIRTVNGTAYTLQNVAALAQASVQWPPDTALEFVVLRGDEQVTLRGTLGRPYVVEAVMEEMPEATAEQVRLRDAWLGG